jgi:hypothetical protein
LFEAYEAVEGGKDNSQFLRDIVENYPELKVKLSMITQEIQVLKERKNWKEPWLYMYENTPSCQRHAESLELIPNMNTTDSVFFSSQDAQAF